MKIPFFLALVGSLLVLSLIACMKCDPYTRSCDLSTGIYSTHTPGTVTYTVQDSGSVFINTLSYHSPQGIITLEKPALPFRISFPVSHPNSIGITARGTAVEGSLTIAYTFVTDGDTVSQKDVCFD